jgi:hypothetical protein
MRASWITDDVLSSSLRPRRGRRPLQGFVIAELHTTGNRDLARSGRSFPTCSFDGNCRLFGYPSGREMYYGKRRQVPSWLHVPSTLCIFGWICMELCGADLDSSSFPQNHRHGWLSIRLASNDFRASVQTVQWPRYGASPQSRVPTVRNTTIHITFTIPRPVLSTKRLPVMHEMVGTQVSVAFDLVGT